MRERGGGGGARGRERCERERGVRVQRNNEVSGSTSNSN